MKTEQEIRQMVEDLKLIIKTTPVMRADECLLLTATCVGLLWALGVEDKTTQHLQHVREMIRAFKGAQTN